MADRREIFSELMELIRERKVNPPEKSYTTALFAGGVEKIGAKVLEESREVVEAAGELASREAPETRAHFVHEVADLLYHTWVLMGHLDVSLSEVEAELGRRFGTSGLDEKAARRK